MARSSIGNLVRRLAAEHRAADELGVTPQAIQTMGPDKVGLELSRRQLLGGAVAAAGVVALGQVPLAQRAGAAGAPRIAVIGAGISGLAAALRMQDSGLACTVYEANTRLGGRIYSDTANWASGQVSEWGGEMIDTGHKAVQALARRFNLTLDDLVQAEPQQAEQTFYFFGQYYLYSQASSDFQVVHQNIQNDMKTFTWPVTWNNPQPGGGTTLSNMSAYDWIESRVPGGHSSPMGALLDVAYNEEYGGQTTDQTALNILGLLAYQPSPGNFSIFGLSDERYHIRGGNDQLPKAMAAALPKGSVNLNWKLTALAANPNGTQTLTFTANGRTQTVTADHTILAVPLGVLKRLDFTRAGFDTRKKGQIANMRMGHDCKLHLQFGARVWNSPGAWPGISSGESYSDTGTMNTWEATRAQAGAEGILVDYTGGDIAAALNPSMPFSNQANPYVVTSARKFLSEIEPVFPGLGTKWNGRATLAAWHVNPYSYGAYSYYPTGYCQNYAGYEAVRQGNVHFAGEHCSIDYQGYMEGGALEGQRAGAEVLGDYGLR
ncbi:MAG TPA: NAD(P)/FAD-dependent oxidoreductase [Jatrophihabitans sp.]|uniref:flavin monoamine oxidase family protein n=1 Tax=Jatrophihabitans sp. TaxID=1932789 RepID=UPI002EE54D7F